jgi:hypothetical protein
VVLPTSTNVFLASWALFPFLFLFSFLFPSHLISFIQSFTPQITTSIFVRWYLTHLISFTTQIRLSGGECRMDLPGPTTSVGSRTDYSVGLWD